MIARKPFSVPRWSILIVIGILGTWNSATLAQEDQQDVLQLTFDSVKFDMETDEVFERDMITDDINDMQGKKISIRGFILPNGTRTTGNTKFILVRDNQECCFGPGAALYDCVLVKLKEDHAVDFTVRPVTVEGTFQIKELEIGGRVMAIYRMRDCTVSQ